MTFNYYKYYKEIKNRTILIVFAWLLCLSICYRYKETLLFILINSSVSFSELSDKPYFIFTNVTEIFHVYLQLILFISNQMTIVTITYQIFMFLALGLYKYEFIKLEKAFQTFLLAWLFSSCLLFNIIVPFSWSFFLSFQESLNGFQSVDLFFEAKLNEYLQYFIDTYHVCLISCQFLTILVVTLTNLSEKLKKTKTFRKLFYLIFVVFSTLITPPDVLSQVCISSLLILLYEFLILVKEVKFSMVTN
jgi:sec-independent protein translocase protein TatC